MGNAEQLMISAFTKAFNKYLYDKCVIGKLAHTEFKDNIKKGMEVDILMPATVTLFDYTGGNLPAAEEAANSLAKIRIDKGKGFNFYIDEIKKQEIEMAPDLDQKVALAKEYTNDAIEQFAAAVDAAYGELYPNAGHQVEDTNHAAITLSASNIKDILAIMQTKFQRGDGKGHNNWVDGQMYAIVPPEFQFFLNKMEDLKYVESGHKSMEKGFIGRLSGWNILVSNNIYKDADGNYYPLFGQKGKTLAGGVQKKLNVKSYEPDENFNTCFKGFGLYGVGAPRADKLGYAKISATPTIGA